MTIIKFSREDLIRYLRLNSISFSTTGGYEEVVSSRISFPGEIVLEVNDNYFKVLEREVAPDKKPKKDAKTS